MVNWKDLCEFNRKWINPSGNNKNPKVVGNRKYKQKEKSKDNSGKQSEAEIIVNYLKEDDAFVKSLNLNKDEYNDLDFIQENCSWIKSKVVYSSLFRFRDLTKASCGMFIAFL